MCFAARNGLVGVKVNYRPAPANPWPAGTQDVGNLLAGSMDVEDLRASWEPLLRRYHDRLCGQGVRDYTWGECVRHYRQNILYPLGAGIALLGHLDIGDDRGLGDAIVLRALTHTADLDSLAAV